MTMSPRTGIDESGAVVPNATIAINNKAMNFSRAITTNTESLQRSCLAGSTTTEDMRMSLSTTQEVVTVEAAIAQVNYVVVFCNPPSRGDSR